MDRPNYITPTGFAALRAEYERLFGTERPALVEVVSWAAGERGSVGERGLPLRQEAAARDRPAAGLAGEADDGGEGGRSRRRG